MMDERRIKKLNDKEYKSGNVVYVMSREQRAEDNWALLYARDVAQQHHAQLYVIFVLYDGYLSAARRSVDFMLTGLEQVQKDLLDKNIPLTILRGDTGRCVADFCEEITAGLIITDFNPIHEDSGWKAVFAKGIHIPMHEVDARNIIPAWEVSNKEEFAARTIRPKIYNKISEFLTDFPRLEYFDNNHKEIVEMNHKSTDWNYLKSEVLCDEGVNKFEGKTWKSGEAAAKKVLHNFIHNKFIAYDTKRNDPNKDNQSNISPYLMFGQISIQRIALEILQFEDKKITDILNKEKNGSANEQGSAAAYLEELIVRASLSDNYCYYNKNYNNFEGAANWAKVTLNKARTDKREYLYTLDQFAESKTHDELWNACQTEMVLSGKMHGYARMYWAKKILEWTRSPEEAFDIAIHLNNLYELDGRCPNGYVGVAWSILGIHDRPWFARPIFGAIRYMARSGMGKKFDTDVYIDRWSKSKLF